MPASSRKSNRDPLNEVLEPLLPEVVAERANQGSPVVAHRVGELMYDDGAQAFADARTAETLFVGSTTEPSPGAALLASEPDFSRVPFVAEEIFVVDAESGTVLETPPLPGQKGRAVR